MERGARHVLLELLTPGFYAVPEADGTVHLEVPGFEGGRVPGAPSVPVKRALVEAIAGRRVRLSSVTASDHERFDGFRVARTGAPEVVVTAEGVVRAGRAQGRNVLASSGFFPRTWAQMRGAIFQGETKKARWNSDRCATIPERGRPFWLGDCWSAWTSRASNSRREGSEDRGDAGRGPCLPGEGAAPWRSW